MRGESVPKTVSGRSPRHFTHAGVRAAAAWGDHALGALLLPSKPLDRMDLAARPDSEGRRMRLREARRAAP
jgi:hypothetical protein